MLPSENKIFIASNKNSYLTRHINSCLVEDSLDSEYGSVLPTKHDPTIVIVDLYEFDEQTETIINDVLESRTRKIILIENALDLYLNSKNALPFSVYSKVIPKNEICEKYLAIEKKIIDSRKQYVIFRVSEVYGLSMPGSLIEQLLFVNSGEFENSIRDFIYDGDVISAIEIALRKEVSGVFDIASGQSIELRKLVELIKKTRQFNNINIQWRRKKLEIAFNCDNFKFYKWEPLVNLEIGLKTLLSFRRNYGKLQGTGNTSRKNF
jgi:hypothetical protein